MIDLNEALSLLWDILKLITLKGSDQKSKGSLGGAMPPHEQEKLAEHVWAPAYDRI